MGVSQSRHKSGSLLCTGEAPFTSYYLSPSLDDQPGKKTVLKLDVHMTNPPFIGMHMTFLILALICSKLTLLKC